MNSRYDEFQRHQKLVRRLKKARTRWEFLCALLEIAREYVRLKRIYFQRKR